MRTNIVIDDTLMQQAQAALGVKTKREAVEEAFRRIIDQERERVAQMRRQQSLLALRGIGWDGDLDAMRTD